MAVPMKEWVAEAKEKYADVPLRQMSHEKFFRDPPRAQVIDRQFFMAPADGTLVYQEWVEPDGVIIDVKGVTVKFADLIKPWTVDVPCLVVGCFMSFYDVHINRMPTGGTLTRQWVDPIRTTNIPMLYVEQGIVKRDQISKGDMTYVSQNARMLNRVNITSLAYHYYMVQIADSDVSAIMPFDNRKHAPLAQSERFSVVRWGSQVDLILPLDERYNFELMQNTTDHVEAGCDPLVRITRQDR